MDLDWLQNEFLKKVQQRGAAIIKARGASSAASAANGAIDSIHNLTQPTAVGDWFSVAVPSDGSYGSPEGIVYGYPMRSDGNKYQIVQDIPINEFGKEKMQATLAELESERDTVKDMLS